MEMQQRFEHLCNIPYIDGSQAYPSHTLDLWLPIERSIKKPGLGYWIVFLHGGAWHDPCITATFADRAAALLQSSGVSTSIDGMASINYRLSPWASHPTSPSSPDDLSRQAIHPNHLEDVISATEYLQRRFQFNEQYILVGHSCGATLAYQTLQWKAMHEHANYIAPQAIVGIAGLYDLLLLRDMDPYHPACQEFLSAAFGSDETVWSNQSPVKGNYERLWPTGKLAVLVTCQDDEYVSPEQRVQMMQALEQWKAGHGRTLKTIDVDGRHDDIWKTGVALASCLEETLLHLTTKFD